MKKWVYLLTGILVGAIVATTGSAAAAQIKSLVGQKVTGELNVVINGQKLQDKGAVIAGKTNAPVRAISDAIGGELTLNGNTIYITTGAPSVKQTEQTNTGSSNKYSGKTKEELEEKKKTLENQIEILKSGKQELLDVIKEIEQINASTTDSNLIKVGEETIAKYKKEIETFSDPELDKCQADLDQIKSALSDLNKL
ncbi:hypothetical protein D3C74_300990 [compost metagenome]